MLTHACDPIPCLEQLTIHACPPPDPMLTFPPILALLTSCAPPPEPPAPPAEPSTTLGMPLPAAWPSRAATLQRLETPPPTRALRIAIDPGHGVGSNSGNSSCLCIDEQDHNLRVAQHLAQSLEAQGQHPTQLTRSDNRGPAYSTRITTAQQGAADLLISLHSDARGEQHHWLPSPDATCSWNDGNPGFSVLWSDEAEPALAEARLTLAAALAARLAEAGFLAYDGHEYQGIYEGHPDHPGVFLDRHEPRKRVRMLRRPTMPSVIIETHNAWDRLEEPRWQEEATLDAFDAAVLTALADWAR